MVVVKVPREGKREAATVSNSDIELDVSWSISSCSTWERRINAAGGSK